MKNMENDDGIDISNENNNNWLGFSLSPQMNIGDHHDDESQPCSASEVVVSSSANFDHSVPLNNNYGYYYYGLEAENVGLYHPPILPIMPLKSDGSIFGMENHLTKSQPQAMGTSSTPKLENFLGATEAMALSLDSIFYSHRNNNASDQNYQNHQNQVQEQQLELHSQQNFSYYSNMRNHDVMLEGSKQSHQSQTTQDCNLHLAEDHHHHGLKMNVPLEDNTNNNNCSNINNGGESCSNNNNNIIGSMVAPPYGDLKSLSLSMSPTSQSSCVTSSTQASPAVNVIDSVVSIDTKKRGSEKVDQKQIVHRKSIDTFGQRTSQYRGVTRHRWTGRYEAHLWDNSCKKEGQSRKGRQVYLGGYDMEEKAARAYDLAALKYWGPSTHINFPLENYQNELEEMKNMTRQEYVAHLRRKSSGFSRGASMYRGVTRHHQHGRWQARIGRVAGNKDLYLGTFSTQEEAAEAYDIAAIKFRGVNAVTNFDITRYDVEKIMASNNLLSSELARRNNIIDHKNSSSYDDNNQQEAILMQKSCGIQTEQQWKMVMYQQSTQQQQLEQNQPRIESCALLDNMFHHHQQQLLLLDESSKMRGQRGHVSNPSSLATSLNSSREGSPVDRTSLPMQLNGMPSEKLLGNGANSNMNSWDPSPHLRARISLPHMPVFAAWTDA